jgi:hypothetical protein
MARHGSRLGLKVVTLRRIVFMALASCVFAPVANAQTGGTTTATTSDNFTNEGSAGATFQKMWVGARASGMAGAYTALAEDITALYWNPAGISRLQGINVGATYTRWFGGVDHNFIGASMPISEKYRIGVSLVQVDYGSMRFAKVDKDQDINAGSFNANDLAFGLTIAGALTDRFSFGATGKYIRNAIHDLSADGFAFDAGSQYQTDFYHTKISLALTNLGPDRSFGGNSLALVVANPDLNFKQQHELDTRLVTSDFPIPLTFRIGIATDAFQGTVEGQKLNLAFDYGAHSDGPETINLGGEYVYEEMLALRAGYAFNQDQLGLGAGAGFKYKTEDFSGTIDYALNVTRSLGQIHRVSISAQFQ